MQKLTPKEVVTNPISEALAKELTYWEIESRNSEGTIRLRLKK